MAEVETETAATVEESVKGDINDKIAETPSPKPRSFSQNSAASAETDSESERSRKPVPTPRKSVTLMEVDSQELQPPPCRAASALSHHEKKISFSIGKIVKL